MPRRGARRCKPLASALRPEVRGCARFQSRRPVEVDTGVNEIIIAGASVETPVKWRSPRRQGRDVRSMAEESGSDTDRLSNQLISVSRDLVRESRGRITVTHKMIAAARDRLHGARNVLQGAVFHRLLRSRRGQ
jgi:hypothetical protein